MVGVVAGDVGICDNLSQCRDFGRDLTGDIVLALVAYEDEFGLGIAHDIFHLLLGGGRINRHRHDSVCECCEIGYEDERVVCGENRYFLCFLQSEDFHCPCGVCRHFGDFIPGIGFPVA